MPVSSRQEIDREMKLKEIIAVSWVVARQTAIVFPTFISLWRYWFSANKQQNLSRRLPKTWSRLVSLHAGIINWANIYICHSYTHYCFRPRWERMQDGNGSLCIPRGMSKFPIILHLFLSQGDKRLQRSLEKPLCRCGWMRKRSDNEKLSQRRRL